MTTKTIALSIVVCSLWACTDPEPCSPDAGPIESIPDWSIDGMNVEIPWAGSGGVNLLRDPSAIRDDELTYSKNAVPVAPGKLGKRGAMGYVASAGVGSEYIPIAAQGPVGTSGMFVALYWSEGNQQLQVGVLDGAGSGIFLDVLNPVTVVPRGAIFIFGGSQYLFGGVPGAEFRKILSETTLSNFSFLGTGNENVFPNVVGRYRSRVVYANFGPGAERLLVFSDDFKADTIGNSVLAANGRNIFVGDDGDQIVAVHEVTVTGDRPRPALLVLLEHSAFIITGQPNQTTDSTPYFGDMEVVRLPYNSGCASASTVVTTPYGTIWAGPDDVWLFRDGQSLEPIGSKIRPVLEHTPDALLYKWTAAYHDGFYRLAIFSEGQGPTDTSPLGEQWWLDLRDGQPIGSPGRRAWENAKWFGPQVFTLPVENDVNVIGTRLFVRDTRPGAAGALFGLNDGAGEFLGTLVHTNIISSYGTNDDRDVTYGAITESLKTRIVDNEIILDIRSKVYELDPIHQKTFWKGEVVFTPYAETRLTYEGNTDGGDLIDTIHKHLNPFGFTASVDKTDSEVLLEKQQAIAFWPDPATRRPGQDVQFRVYDTAGWVISEGYNDEFAFDLAGELMVAQLTPGFYATLQDFLNHLTSTMGVFIHNVSGEPHPATITITQDDGTTWFPMFVAGTATDAQKRKTRVIGAMLGFDTSVNPATGVTQSTSEPVYAKRAARMEFSAFSGTLRVTKRRPQ